MLRLSVRLRAEGKNSPWLQTPSHSMPSIRRGTASSTSW